jgi:hypothetical protein
MKGIEKEKRAERKVKWSSMRLSMGIFFILFVISNSFLAEAKPKRPFGALDLACVKENPISFKVITLPTIDSFWNAYEIESQASNNFDALIFKFQKPKYVFVAVFPTLKEMNSILGRPAVFLTEGKKLLSYMDLKSYAGLNDYIGHDLYEPLLRDFAKALMDKEEGMILPEKSELKCLCKESSFWKEFLWPSLKAPGKMILIAASKEYKLEFTLSHELHHAIFYSDSRLRKAVKKYWDEKVDPEVQKQIIGILAACNYDFQSNEELLLNEFFAYLLQYNAEVDILGELYSLHSQKLRESLKNQGFDIPIFAAK